MYVTQNDFKEEKHVFFLMLVQTNIFICGAYMFADITLLIYTLFIYHELQKSTIIIVMKKLWLLFFSAVERKAKNILIRASLYLIIISSYIWHVNILKCLYLLDTQFVKYWWRYYVSNMNGFQSNDYWCLDTHFVNVWWVQWTDNCWSLCQRSERNLSFPTFILIKIWS